MYTFIVPPGFDINLIELRLHVPLSRIAIIKLIFAKVKLSPLAILVPKAVLAIQNNHQNKYLLLKSL